MRTILVQGDTAAEYGASAIAAKKQVKLMGYDPNTDQRPDSPQGMPTTFWFGGEVGTEPELVVQWADYSGPRASDNEALSIMLELLGV